MFLIGARILSGTVSAEQAGEAFARLADVLIRAVHRAVEENFAAAHGRLRGQQSAVLALGKLGGREMTAASDLDLIIVYDFDENAAAVRRRAAALRRAVFRALTQRLVSALVGADQLRRALSMSTCGCGPPGRSGPVATMLGSFESYQENEAWTWEHLALTRARVVSGPPAFAARVEKVIRDVLCRPRDAETIAGDVVEMRGAIAAEKGDKRALGPEICRGRAGRSRIHRAVSAARPRRREAGHPRHRDRARARQGGAARRAARRRMPTCCARRCGSIRTSRRSCGCASPGRSIRRAAGPGLLSLLARAADVPDFATLEAHLAETQARVRASFVRILGRAP